MNEIRRSVFALKVFLTAALTIGSLTHVAGADSCTATTPDKLCIDAPSPALHRHCMELASYLVEFQGTTCGLGIPTPDYHPSYAAHLGLANGHYGTSLLEQWFMDSAEKELDRLTEMGVSVIVLDITYPLLTQTFHDYVTLVDRSYNYTADDYLAFYAELISKIRARDLQVHVEHSTILEDFSATNPAPYFETIKVLGPTRARERYRVENANENYLILTQLAPDYLSILTEPDTQNNAFGTIRGETLFTPEQWKDFVQYTISLFPPHSAKIGAGVGTWDSEYYIDLLAPMPELDYIDFHIYPARGIFQDFFERVLSWADLVRSYDPAKTITIGEAWLYKVVADETLEVDELEFLSRDTYHYWEALDQKFIELFALVSRKKEIEVFAPFWTRSFFAYLNYDDTFLLAPQKRLSTTMAAAFDNMQNGVLTETGLLYKDIALETNILVVSRVSPDHGPETGPGAHQMVTIIGENFTPKTNVKFGELFATDVKTVDENTLTAVTPMGSGTADVTVMAEDGRVRRKPQAYVYDPPPVISTITPNSGPESYSQRVQIKGKNFVAGSTVYFSNSPAAIVAEYNGIIIVKTPPGTGTVDVSVFNPDQQRGVLPDGYTYESPPRNVSLPSVRKHSLEKP